MGSRHFIEDIKHENNSGQLYGNKQIEFIIGGYTILYDMKMKAYLKDNIASSWIIDEKKILWAGLCVLLHDTDTGHRPVGTSPGHSHGWVWWGHKYECCLRPKNISTF